MTPAAPLTDEAAAVPSPTNPQAAGSGVGPYVSVPGFETELCLTEYGWVGVGWVVERRKQGMSGGFCPTQAAALCRLEQMGFIRFLEW